MTRLQEFALGFILILTGVTLFTTFKIWEKVANSSQPTPTPYYLILVVSVVGAVMVGRSLIKKA